MLHNQPACKGAGRALIDVLLLATLAAARDAMVIDLYRVNPADAGSAGAPTLYNALTSVQRNKRSGVPKLREQPIGDWAEFSLHLRTGRCRTLGLRDFRPSPLRDRFRTLAVSGILACPVIGPDSGLLAAMFILWTSPHAMPSSTELAYPMDHARQTAQQISLVLDLCDHAASPVPTVV